MIHRLRIGVLHCLSMCVVVQVVCITTHAQAQQSALNDEAKRLQGHWRIVEMVEDGRTIPESEMRYSLPGGGLVEIVDYTLLFKSPVDGSKSTKSFRMDPTSYPKAIAVMELDQVTGVGIYQIDKGRFVVCVADPKSPTPTEFAAPKDSGRVLIVLERDASGDNAAPKLHTPVPPVQAQRQASPRPQVANPPSPPPQVVIPASQKVAARFLSDADVKAMLIGKWRMNDTEGTIDITFDLNGGFLTFRHAQVINTFHTVFVPTPVSSGVWSVQNGRLYLTISSSWRSDLVNTTASYAVRSISASDAIVVDQLGRVAKVVKLP